MRLRAFLLAGLVGAAACTSLQKAGDLADAGGEDGVGTSPEGGAGADADAGKPRADGGTVTGPPGPVGPGGDCRPFALPCLDPALPNVIEVPTEATLAEAFASAQANDIVQIKNRKVAAGWRVPAYITLRGCDAAEIIGSLGFQGSAGIVEGFIVPTPGTIVANVTGSFIVRQNRITGGVASNEPGISGRAVDGIVGADVTLLVEGNLFFDRTTGVEAATSYHTNTRKVAITVQNNAFVRVAEPFVASEGGMVGVIRATVTHNTFYGFDTAIRLTSMTETTPTRGNLFASGGTAISGSPFTVAYSLTHAVTLSSDVPPLSGAFAGGDPAFVDADAGDVRLGASSNAVDLVPNGTEMPALDLAGCPRPAGPAGATPHGDVGAFEAQPL